MRLTAGCFDRLNMTIRRITNIPCHSERIEESRGNEMSLYLRHCTSFRSREIATPNKSARNDKVFGLRLKEKAPIWVTEKLQEKKHLKSAFSWQGRRDSQGARRRNNGERRIYSPSEVSDATAAQGTKFLCDELRVWVTEKLQEKKHLKGAFSWQGRRDSNTQPTVLETVALPLSHSP